MASAQAIVNQVDAKSVPSLTASLTAVQEAYDVCEKAKLGSEREQLLKAKNEIRAQLDLLEARALRKKHAAPTAEELAKLVKQGDPSCPKGQAYKPKDAKHEVRCTGPQIVDMGSQALKEYYGDRRFKVTSSDSPAQVTAELGSEKYVFAFDKLSDSAPRCVTAYALPGMSWQELTARLTGIAPEKLKLDAPVRSSHGELTLRVEHPTDKPTVRIGKCEAAGQGPATDETSRR
jgi:hypothetical protein